VPRVSGSLLKDDATREREQREIKSYRELVDLVNSKVSQFRILIRFVQGVCSTV